MFIFDFNWQIQHFLNQFWWQINFLLLIILVILGYLAYNKPIYAVGLTIILLPTYLFRSQIWFLPFTFLELCIWVTFLGWLINRLKNKNSTPYPLIPSPYKWPIILILIAATIAIFISPNLREAAGLWKAYFVEPILFFLILINVVRMRGAEPLDSAEDTLSKNREIILWSLGISTLVISLLAIFQKFTGFGIAEPSWMDVSHRRVTSIFTSPNAVGLYLGPIVVIYLAWIITDLKSIFTKPRNLLTTYYYLLTSKLLIIVLALAAILFTVSQGTWLGLLAAIIFLAYFKWNKKWTIAIVLVSIILILIIPTTRDIAWPILTFQDSAGQNRITLLQISRQHLLESPKNFIFGAGIFGFPQIQNQFRDPLQMQALLYPHNIIFNFWLEIGLLGLIAFTWLIIKFFKTGFQKLKTNNQQLALALMAAMIVIIVHGLVDVPYFKNDLAILFWIIVGLLI